MTDDLTAFKKKFCNLGPLTEPLDAATFEALAARARSVARAHDHSCTTRAEDAMNANGKTDEEVAAFLGELQELYRRHGLAVRGEGLRIQALGPCNGLHASRNPDRSLSLLEHMTRPDPAPHIVVAEHD